MDSKRLYVILGIVGLVVFLWVLGKRRNEPSMQDVIAQNPMFAHFVDQADISNLHMAVIQGNTESVRKLLDAGAEVNAKSSDGTTPLHMAAVFGQLRSAELLLATGADPLAQSNGGDTPLALAAQAGKPQLVELLLLNGAQVDITNKKGQTALDVALLCRRNMAEAPRLLKGALSGYKENLDECIQLLSEKKAK
ncbi:MAG: ankyrin repeat domain-containing protein [Sedimentisphaerales bacterium]|nr:ankyrin repeat domain-containing protein [Sedimentisphaerales bacterium]